MAQIYESVIYLIVDITNICCSLLEGVMTGFFNGTLRHVFMVVLYTYVNIMSVTHERQCSSIVDMVWACFYLDANSYILLQANHGFPKFVLLVN